MLRSTWIATALAPFVVLAAGTVVPGAERPASRSPGLDRLPVDASRMLTFVKSPHPDELRWQQIPWLTDLEKAIRQAKAEKRPLVLFISGDDPLEKC
ncbi:MAG: hypothetical protein U0840_26550 [Gemmataceae bacterium]